MASVASKLSRNVLQMKFMRRVKDQVDKQRTAEKFREIYYPQQFKAETEDGLSSSSPRQSQQSSIPSQPIKRSNVVEVPSFNQCEDFVFGRQSFGGFNPDVEANVKSGRWRPFYLDDEDDTAESHMKSCKSEDGELSSSDSEVEVSDKNMAKSFGSLVGTLGKRFRKKQKNNNNKSNNNNNKGKKRAQQPNRKKIKMDYDNSCEEDGVDVSSFQEVKKEGKFEGECEEESSGKNKRKNKKGWKKFVPNPMFSARGKKRQRETGAESVREDGVATKKLKFMKPEPDF